jgi:hypothetical protein
MNVTILDNFYEDPDSVLSMITNDFPIVGCGSGARTIPLKDMNETLYKSFCDKIYSIHNIDPTNLSLITFFMEHEYHPIEIMNQRFVHIDGKNPDVCYMTMKEYKLVLCGQIFLTKDSDPAAGVRICKLKDHINWTETELMNNCINNYLDPKVAFEAGKITLEEYKLLHKHYHDNFEVTSVIDNVYNRMVSWKAGTLHGDPMTKKMGKRLTQYFFIQKN